MSRIAWHVIPADQYGPELHSANVADGTVDRAVGYLPVDHHGIVVSGLVSEDDMCPGRWLWEAAGRRVLTDDLEVSTRGEAGSLAEAKASVEATLAPLWDPAQGFVDQGPRRSFHEINGRGPWYV